MPRSQSEKVKGIEIGGAAKSYLKTTVASFAVFIVASMVAVLGWTQLPDSLWLGTSVLGISLVSAAAIFVCASLVVLLRQYRDSLGKLDLFLSLNRSREPDAISAAPPARVSRIRRRMARWMLGHEHVVGDTVEIKSWSEIRKTLDDEGCLDGLPFMPEMIDMCGQRAIVFRCMHRLFDYRKSRRMRHMDGTVLLVASVCDGSAHGKCDASCHLIWKAAWLRRNDESPSDHDAKEVPGNTHDRRDVDILRLGTEAPRYRCQLTQLNVASQPVGSWNIKNSLRPLISGNVAPLAFVVGRLTSLFNRVQHLRQGIAYPPFDLTKQAREDPPEIRLAAGDYVVVRPAAEIRRTLNSRLMHRGLWFEEDMLKFSEHRYSVQCEVNQVIDIVTGKMLTMKTPAYILRGVHFSGERQQFNSQYEPLFWRSVWLRRSQ